VTAVFEGALEADFVVLRSSDVRLATLALRFPGTEALWPGPLRRGIADLRIVVGPGWRVIKGGPAWEARYRRVQPLRPALTEAQFGALCSNFWAQAVWCAKKAQRGEFRACQRGIHEHLLEAALRLMQEEAALAGRRSYPLGRRAESWLTEEELRATAPGTRPERPALLAAIRLAADAFSRVSAAVAAARGWPCADPSALRAWLGAATAGAA
jgi:hypothetical protein